MAPHDLGDTMTETVHPHEPPVRVTRWSSEEPLFALLLVLSSMIWFALVVSLIGIFYAVIFGMFFFVAHLGFIAHLRGSAVRLGPEQMPDLYQRVVKLAHKIGLRFVPDVYVVQAGGVLNALATKFFGSNFIVLYSDLLEACGENEDAMDFIIAHELGHLHAGHLQWRGLILPGLFVPFLGTAYSRACEYTCDRYGMAVSKNPERALDGLCILAAGGTHGPRVNRRALVRQCSDLNTVLMKIGHWLSTHPPIAHRLAVLQPSLAEAPAKGGGAAFAAVALVVSLFLLPFLGLFGLASGMASGIRKELESQHRAMTSNGEQDDARVRVEEGILSLVDAADAHQAETGRTPIDLNELYEIWSARHPGEDEPRDPYDGQRFGYYVDDVDYVIWSAGQDPQDDSDDLYYSSREGKEEVSEETGDSSAPSRS